MKSKCDTLFDRPYQPSRDEILDAVAEDIVSRHSEFVQCKKVRYITFGKNHDLGHMFVLNIVEMPKLYFLTLVGHRLSAKGRRLASDYLEGITWCASLEPIPEWDGYSHE